MATILDDSQQGEDTVQFDQRSHIENECPATEAAGAGHFHFLIVTMAIQGQITPARHLARRLSRTTGMRVTLAIPLSSHRRMFPSSHVENADADDEVGIVVDEGLVSYAAYSDGYDRQGFQPDIHDGNHFMARFKLVGSQTLSRLARSLADRGRRVTCVLYTILLHWAADVARDALGVPSVLYWTQPAAVFGIYYHYFHGYAEVISAHKDDPSFAINLPGLPQLQIKDLPSILTDSNSPYLDSYRDMMKVVDKEILGKSSSSGNRSRPKQPSVVINTFHALEADAIDAINSNTLNLLPIGPIIERDANSAASDLFEEDRSGYIEWLDSKEERSVVYISFGSISKFSRGQMEEIWEGLKESGRPYLWVVRRDTGSRDDELLQQLQGQGQGQQGMVVEWCNQVRVLSHPSVGCFVTHCGWNSMLESIACGVPMLMVPQWIEQATNAKLAEGVWGIGVRAEVNGEGVMGRGELKRCLDVILNVLEGEGEAAAADGKEMTSMIIRSKAEMWRDKACEAVAVANQSDGPWVRSLMALVN